MKCGLSPKDLGRAIARIVVEKRPRAAHFVLEIRKPAAAYSRILIILAEQGEPNAITRRQHDARWPDLDVEIGDLAGTQRTQRVVRMPGTIRRTAGDVTLAMRDAQPALSKRCVRIDRALKNNLIAARRE